MAQQPTTTISQDNVRKAAWAGSFYENDPAELKNSILRYIADGKPLSEPVRFLISPHAGYIFSGPVAAKGYATLDKNVKRVFIIGPSHRQAFTGIAVPKFAFYETPLGKVAIDRATVDKLRQERGVIEAKGFDEQEHCLEVQVPFLQVRLKEFSIVPIIIGDADPAKVAALLLPFIDGTTAVIASSDLSHYETQQRAVAIDGATIATILSGNVKGDIDACGEIPIRILMHIAMQLKLQPVKIDARTSFDTAPQQCPRDRVVGYTSIGYVSSAAAEATHGVCGASVNEQERTLSDDTKKMLLQLARQSMEAAVRRQPFTMPAQFPAEVKENAGCFVTLTVDGNLRGCIGYIEPIKPLYEAVADNAKNAALGDPRFPTVSPGELSRITVEVSVLTKPTPLPYNGPDDLLGKLVAGRDGVILSKGMHQSTYLPQVWEQLPDKVMFLEQLSVKGGMPRDGWKNADVKTYRAIHFSE
jgi:MEMO1 family protein